MIDVFKNEHDWLSNFYISPFTVNGVVFKTNEHYFAACKTLDPELCRFIIEAPSAKEAKRRGRLVTMRPDWDRVKFTVMAAGLWYKFTQHPELEEKLIATGTEKLVEGNWWHDNLWGDCRCGNKDGRHPQCLQPGKNALGQFLMSLRNVFQTTRMLLNG